MEGFNPIKKNTSPDDKKTISRREFLETAGMILGGASFAEALEQKKGARKDSQPARRSEMIGSPQSLDRQNLIALVGDLSPIQSIVELKALEKTNPPSMVPLPDNGVLNIAKNLKEEERNYCRPWTAKFLNILSTEWKRKFPKVHLRVSSSVRPIDLGKVNSNASPRSTHPVGNTVDISYEGMTREEDRWMQVYMALLEGRNFVAAVNLRTLTPVQKQWLNKLTKARRDSIIKSQDKNGNVKLILPVVEATKELDQHCFHFAVAKVSPYI